MNPNNNPSRNHFTRVPWAAETTIYEVNIRQYTVEGTFKSFKKHLPRLREMGIQTLWFMPVTPISQLNRKGTLGSYYACSSYTQINLEFGTLDDFKSLVNEAHSLGFKILIDWVANHTGCDHDWTLSHPDFYKKNYAGQFYDAHGWEDVIDLNYDNLQLWKAMTDAMSFWVTACNVDGFRCDMAHLVPLDFWAYARKTLDKQKPLLWLAETEEANYYEVFDATYAWELLHAMENLCKGQMNLWQFIDVLNRYESSFLTDALRLLFTSNHDENSHSGSEWERLGNGATAFAVLCMTWKNSLPLIYSGQEMPNNKRLFFFEKDEIKWTGENKLEGFYKQLATLRKTNVALHATAEKGTTTIIANNHPFNILAYSRTASNEEVLVVLNLSQDTVEVNLYDYNLSSEMKEVFTSEVFQNKPLEMIGWSYKVFVKQQ